MLEMKTVQCGSPLENQPDKTTKNKIQKSKRKRVDERLWEAPYSNTFKRLLAITTGVSSKILQLPKLPVQ
jgi:hypothetical protein